MMRQRTATRARKRMPWWGLLIVASLATGVMLAFSPFVAPVALAVLITGVVALAKNKRTWLRFGSRSSAAVVTSAAAVVFLITASVSVAVLPNMGRVPDTQAARFAGLTLPTSTPSPEDTPSARPTRTSTPTPTPVKTTREETVVEALPFAESVVDDGNLAAGQTQVRAEGRNGEKKLTYLVHLVDGEEVSRELISEVVITEPVARVTANGTYVAPPPPPAPVQQNPGCDPNYAEACVPIASDVDCVGGGGNGPAYFSGIAKVVGTDVYGLDRDGDGYACEPN